MPGFQEMKLEFEPHSLNAESVLSLLELKKRTFVKTPRNPFWKIFCPLSHPLSLLSTPVTFSCSLALLSLEMVFLLDHVITSQSVFLPF